MEQVKVKRPTRFRILIIGRANAGKTTILRAVCGTEEEPDAYDHKGRLIDPNSIRSKFLSIRDRIKGKSSGSTFLPSSKRGLHNIDYSLVFRSNPGFIFHDSRGFESGATDELELVRKFIQDRAAKGTMEEQLHAIWYCFPTDSNRIIMAAEQEFFKNIDTGSVPVIAVFTKFDGLDAAACRTLQEINNIPFKQAKQDALTYAEEQFNRTHLPLILDQAHPPKAVVCLRNMQKKESHHLIQRATSKLIESTVDALDDDALKLLLVLVQHTNVELCIKSAVESGTITDAAQALAGQADGGIFKPERKFFMDIFKWFPYIWTKDTLEDKGEGYGDKYDYADYYAKKYDYDKYDKGAKAYYADGAYGYNLGKAAFYFQQVLAPMLPHFVGSLPPPLQVLTIGLTAIIVAANAFWLQPGDVNAPTVQNVFTLYIKSGSSDQVKAAVISNLSGLAGPYNAPTYKAQLVQIVLNAHVLKSPSPLGP